MDELFRTNDPTEISLATALLKAHGIELYVVDVHMSILEGSIGAIPRRVLVSMNDLAQARMILRGSGLPIDVG